MNLSGTVVIYTGKGGRLAETFDFCSEYHLPLIQASTGQELPTDPTYTLVNAPNLALPIIAFFKGLKAFSEVYGQVGEAFNVHVLESHQSAKKSLPGTAAKIASILGYTMQPADSVRDTETQVRLGIPEPHLGRHAFHQITIEGMGVEIGLTTKVLGLTPYGPGALWLSERILAGVQPGGGILDGIYEAEYFLK